MGPWALGPKMDVIIFCKNKTYLKKHFLKESTFFMITQAQNQDENDRKWII